MDDSHRGARGFHPVQGDVFIPHSVGYTDLSDEDSTRNQLRNCREIHFRRRFGRPIHGLNVSCPSEVESEPDASER